MLGATLALAILVLGASASSEPSALVLQLGATKFTDRESAGSELARLGRVALPALRAARDSKDPEIRLRVTALLAKIESSLLVEATPIALEFRDVPIGQAIRTINEQSGLNLLLGPEEIAGAADRRMTLQSAEPLPFWKGIDALCEAGQLHYQHEIQALPGRLDGAFTLIAGSAPSNELRADSGPFRVLLTNVQRQGEVQLPQPRTSPFIRSNPLPNPAKTQSPPSKRFFLQLLVLAEPRLSITQNGAVKLITAVDDQGQSLVPRREIGTFQHSAGYFGMNPSPTVRLRLDLNYPENSGHRIRLVRGTIPVQVATRRPEPFEISLANSIGQSFRNNDVTLAIRDSRPAQKSQPATIEISIKPIGPGTSPIDAGEGEPLAYRPDSPQQQIEVLDAQGRVLPWFPSGIFYNGDETRLRLTLIPRGTPIVPAKLRYHEIIRTAAEVPFEFRNVPIP